MEPAPDKNATSSQESDKTERPLPLLFLPHATTARGHGAVSGLYTRKPAYSRVSRVARFRWTRNAGTSIQIILKQYIGPHT